MIERKVVSAGICTHYDGIEEAAVMVLVIFLKYFLGKAAFLCRQRYELLIIEVYAEFLCQSFSYLSSAASVFSSYGNDYSVSVHKNSSS